MDSLDLNSRELDKFRSGDSDELSITASGLHWVFRSYQARVCNYVSTYYRNLKYRRHVTTHIDY